jgi:MFS family permease
MADVESPSPTAPENPMPGQAPRGALVTIFLVVVIDLLGFGIVLPLLPRFGERYVEAVFGGAKGGLGGAILGGLMATFSAMQFVFAPAWGRLSDRIGRRPVLLIGLGGSVLFYAMFGYASGLHDSLAGLALLLLFVARAGAGIAGATIACAQAVIADCTPPERRKHGMALIGAAFGIGFTIGPLVGFSALSMFPNNHESVGYTAAALSFLALLVGFVRMPETRRFSQAPPLERKWFDPQAAVAAIGSPAIGPVILTFFLASLGFASFEVTLSLLNKDALQVNDNKNFLVFAYVGFVLMLAQGVLYRRLAKRVSEPTFMACGISLMGLGVVSLGGVSWLAFQKVGFSTLLPLQLVSLTLAVVGFALLTPSAQALISRRTVAERQGEILGVNQSASALARILGPLFGLTLYKTTPNHLLPYLFGGGLLLLMLPLIPRIRRGGTANAEGTL